MSKTKTESLTFSLNATVILYFYVILSYICVYNIFYHYFLINLNYNCTQDVTAEASEIWCNFSYCDFIKHSYEVGIKCMELFTEELFKNNLHHIFILLLLCGVSETFWPDFIPCSRFILVSLFFLFCSLFKWIRVANKSKFWFLWLTHKDPVFGSSQMIFSSIFNPS